MNRINKRVSDMVSPLHHSADGDVEYRFYVYEGDAIAGEDFEYDDDAIDFAQDLVDRGTDYEVTVERRTYSTHADGSIDDVVDTEIIWSSEDYKVSDSRKIKDADEADTDTDTDTDDVIDGLLIITFKDGSEEDGLAAVQEHANEQGDNYETYEVKEQDGKVGVDMCAQTSDPNGFVKELLNAWGVLDAVADVDFKKSDLMEEAEQGEVGDSKRVKDSSMSIDELEDKLHEFNPNLYIKGNAKTGYSIFCNWNLSTERRVVDKLEDYGFVVTEIDDIRSVVYFDEGDKVSDSRKITDSTYGTSFTLTNPVNDYNAALDYLQADDMTQYLIDDLDYLGLSHLEGKIKEIRWVLEDEQSGYIVLYTTEPLAEEDLDKISEWISGQCSDGLGEGFEQQDFASGEDFEEYEYEDEDGETQTDYEEVNTMASFDWETNDYKLKLYDSVRIKDAVDPEKIRGWVQHAMWEIERDGLELTEDVIKDYVGYNEHDAETQEWFDSIIEDELENIDEPQAKDYWAEAEDRYLMGRRADSRIKDGCGEDAESVGKVNNTDILRDNKNGGVYVWVNGKKKKFSTKKDAEEYIKKTFNEDGTPKK